MASLISASEWPVFDCYEITFGCDGAEVICPAENATIRERIDLMSPAMRYEALTAALRLVRWEAGSARELKLARYFGLGDLKHSELLDYAHRFGLFGIGPSYIVRAVQKLKGRFPYVMTDRVAGELRRAGSSGKDFDGPPLTLVRPFALNLEEWRFTRYGVSESDAFAHEIGSDAWWALYAEPLEDVVQAAGKLQADPVTIEPLLADTFIRLPASKGRSIDPSTVIMRSVSAIGALALGVMDGELDGVRVCEYELCRARFIPKRSDQRFCSAGCRDKKHKRDKYRKGGGNDGD